LRPAAPDLIPREESGRVDAIRALTEGLRAAALGSASDVLETFAEVAADICAADAVVIRLADADGSGFTARAVHARSPALAAELAGSHVPAEDATRPLRLGYALSAPIEVDGKTTGSLEVLRERQAFTETEQVLAELAAAQLALVLRVDGQEAAAGHAWAERALVLAGEALAAGSDDAPRPRPPALARRFSGVRTATSRGLPRRSATLRRPSPPQSPPRASRSTRATSSSESASEERPSSAFASGSLRPASCSSCSTKIRTRASSPA
jgi:GAF domain-containing protein